MHLASGAGRISEIASRLGLPANQLTHYIELLRDLFLVHREVPILEKNPAHSKKGFYQVSDPFLRLWFGAIYPYDSFLEFGQADLIMERLNPLIRNHIAFCYEQLCRDFVRSTYATFGCLKVGRQWSGNYEIDVAGVDANFSYLLFSRAGFTEELERAAENDADLFLISSLFEDPAPIPFHEP